MPPRAPSARTPGAARAPLTRSPSSPPTSSWARCAPRTACTSARGSSSTTSRARPEQFVTRRVTRGAAAIALGLQDELALGSLEAVRDWSFAGDIVRGAWLMLRRSARGLRARERRRPHRRRARRHGVRVCRPGRRALPPRRRGPRARRRAHAERGRPHRARGGSAGGPELSFEQLIEGMVRADVRSLRSAAA